MVMHFQSLSEGAVVLQWLLCETLPLLDLQHIGRLATARPSAAQLGASSALPVRSYYDCTIYDHLSYN